MSRQIKSFGEALRELEASVGQEAICSMLARALISYAHQHSADEITFTDDAGTVTVSRTVRAKSMLN